MPLSETLRQARSIARQYEARAVGYDKRLARGDRSVSLQDPVNARNAARVINTLCDLVEKAPSRVG